MDSIVAYVAQRKRISHGKDALFTIFKSEKKRLLLDTGSNFYAQRRIKRIMNKSAIGSFESFKYAGYCDNKNQL